MLSVDVRSCGRWTYKLKVFPPASLAAHWGIFSSDVLKLVKNLFFIDLDQKDFLPDNHPVSQKKIIKPQMQGKNTPYEST